MLLFAIILLTTISCRNKSALLCKIPACPGFVEREGYKKREKGLDNLIVLRAKDQVEDKARSPFSLCSFWLALADARIKSGEQKKRKPSLI